MALKDKLKPRVFERLVIDADGPEEVEIIHATQGLRIELFEAARNAGELNEKFEATSKLAGMRFAGRVVAALLYQGGERVLTGDDAAIQALSLPEFDRLAEVATRSFGGEALEKTQGE